MKTRSATLIILYIFISVSLSGQTDYTWWNEINNWDGVTPWDLYIIRSPGYMGPNALPVPEIKSGILQDEFNLQLCTDLHYSKGDNTQDIFSSIWLPLAGDKIGFELYGVIVEHYKMNQETRDQRHSRDFDAKGYSFGDFNIATYISLLRGHEKIPDMSLRIAFRFPSGSNLEGARFTDAPGYHLDMLLSKKITEYIRIKGMAGFYSWQIYYHNNRVIYHQDDAFLYGTGLVYDKNKFIIEGNIAGYSGYINILDSPLVIRLKTEVTLGKIKSNLLIQKGLKEDLNYSTIRFGIRIPLNIDVF